MNAKNPRSFYAAVLLVGFVFLGLGAWGIYYSGSNSDRKKEIALSPLPQPEPTASQTPKLEPLLIAPEKTPVPQAATPHPKATPALITAGQKPTPASKPNESRSLSDKQHQQIMDILRKHAGKTITICAVESDTAGIAFAETLKRIFEEAGWHVEGVKQVPYAKPPVGLNLAAGSFPSPESLVAAYTAFTSAGFSVSQQLDAKLTGGQAELIVGAQQ